VNREIAVVKRKCFVCKDFEYIIYYCRNRREIEENRRIEIGRPEHWSSSNKFKVLTSKVMQAGISSKKQEKKKKKLLREVMVKIRLKQKDEKDEIMVEVLLDSGATELVISSEFTRKNKFKKKKLERPIYVKNVDNTFNYEGLMVKVELFYREHKERIELVVIGE